MHPTAAARDAMRRIYDGAGCFQGALVAMDASGHHGGAAVGWVFHYSVAAQENEGNVTVLEVQPMHIEGGV